MVSLDGSTRIEATEYVLLTATLPTKLASEAYVDEVVAGGSVDLTNYYNKTEVDGFVDAKLDINNPQVMSGTFRIDPHGKLIVNAVASDKNFYCNGDSEVNGNFF